MSKYRDFWRETNNSQGLFFQDLGMKSRDNILADLHEMSYSRARHTTPLSILPRTRAVHPQIASPYAHIMENPKLPFDVAELLL